MRTYNSTSIFCLVLCVYRVWMLKAVILRPNPLKIQKMMTVFTST